MKILRARVGTCPSVNDAVNREKRHDDGRVASSRWRGQRGGTGRAKVDPLSSVLDTMSTTECFISATGYFSYFRKHTTRRELL